jgi:hypothetical protein
MFVDSTRRDTIVSSTDASRAHRREGFSTVRPIDRASTTRAWTV